MVTLLVTMVTPHNSHTTGCKSQLTGCFPFRTPSFPNGRSCLRHVTIGFDRETNKFLLCSKEFDSLDLLVAFFKVRNSNHNWIYCLHTQTIEQIPSQDKQLLLFELSPSAHQLSHSNIPYKSCRVSRTPDPKVFMFLKSCLSQTTPIKAHNGPNMYLRYPVPVDAQLDEECKQSWRTTRTGTVLTDQ